MSIKKLLLIVALMVGANILPQSLKAQASLSEGQMSAGTKGYQELTSYNSMYSNVSYSSALYVTLPFNFYYDGRLTRYITMAGCGGLKFGETSSSPYYNRQFYKYQDLFSYEYLYYTSYYRDYGGFVYPFWMDNWPSAFTVERSMKYYYYGSVGSRIAVFQWKGLVFDYRNSCYQNLSINFQVRIYEGSNEIEIHYGTMNRDGLGICVDGNCGGNLCTNYGSTCGMIGLTQYYTGSPSSSSFYLNVDPNGNGNMGYGKWEYGKNSLHGTPLSRGFGANEAVRDNATFDQITNGTFLKLTFGPRIISEAPTSGVNLRRNYIYGDGSVDPLGYGDDQHPQMTISKIPGGATVNKQIMGPLSFPVHPNYKVIYNATDNFSESVNKKFATATPGATSNPAFGSSPAGSLDLQSNSGSISTGTYRVANDLIHNVKHYLNEYTFNIANDWDIEINRVLYPKTINETSYPGTALIPLKLRLTNRGLNEIASFWTVVRIFNSGDVEVYKDSIKWEAETPDKRLKLGDILDLDFKVWNPLGNYGEYSVEAYTYLAGDQEIMNNYWPWAINSTKHVFAVLPETDGAAIGLINPSNENGNEIFVGRPTKPRGRFKNVGISDISDATGILSILRVEDDKEVFNKSSKIASIAAGGLMNETDAEFDYFTPDAPGDYIATLTLDLLDDEVLSNNVSYDTFTVIHALAGKYTIGPNKNTGNLINDSIYNSKNFTKIQDAIDALYLRGVSSPVVFEFTTGTINCGDETLISYTPAVDLRSTINGMNSVNTVTFKPSAQL